MFARSKAHSVPHQSYTNILPATHSALTATPAARTSFAQHQRGLAASVAPPPGANPNAQPVEHAQTQVNRPVKWRSGRLRQRRRRPAKTPKRARHLACARPLIAKPKPSQRAQILFRASANGNFQFPPEPATPFRVAKRPPSPPRQNQLPQATHLFSPAPRRRYQPRHPLYEPKLLNPDQIGVVAHCPSILFRSAPDRQLCRATPKSAPPKSSKSEDLELPLKDRILAGDRARF